jgi:hypothetical protein
MLGRYFAFVALSAVAQPVVLGQSAGAVVRQVDHVLFTTQDDGRPLVSLLTERLALPIVWPQPGEAWTASTGICLGNVNLEVFHRAPAPTTEAPRPARITSLALQPNDLSGALRALQSRSIDHIPPEPLVRNAGDPLPRWIAVPLRGFGHGLFLLQYVFDMDERRARFDRVLRERDGGPLGVLRLREVVIAPDRLDHVREQWTKLLGPVSSGETDVWVVGDGPRVRLVTAGDARAGSLVLEVRSVSRAAGVLRRLGIGFQTMRRELRVDPKGTFGLQLVLGEGGLSARQAVGRLTRVAPDGRLWNRDGRW